MTAALGVLGALLLLGGGGALIWAGRRQASANSVERLRAVIDAPRDAQKDKGTDDSVGALATLWSQLGRVADKAGRGSNTFTWLGDKLERAGWPLRPGEAAVGVAGLAVAGALLGGAAAGPGGAVLLALLAGGGPIFWLKRTAAKVSVKADRQLPELLGSLAASMRSGHSLTQGLEAVADQTGPPLGREFQRVLAETQMGRGLDGALEAMAERVDSNDLRWTVRAMVIQSRTGGRLADILEVLSEFMRDREEVRREIKALTAEGRISALILGGLPFFVAGALLFLSPDYLNPLFAEPMGWAMLAGAGVLMGFAMMWIRKIIQIEV